MNTSANDIVESQDVIAPVKKKRGRKPKNQTNTNEIIENEVHVPKKRGRKPKGGKIVVPVQPTNTNVSFKENVILHLKCKLNKIEKSIEDSIDYHNINSVNSKMTSLQFENLNFKGTNEIVSNSEYNNEEVLNETQETSENTSEIIYKKQINKKLKEVQKLFYNDSLYGKRSACFWCSCDFDNHPIQIPKSKVKSNYHVYGCFCSPECGVSYLMNELIDTSQKYERYQMMNYIYGSIFEYKDNIKPAPDPHYLLDKFYGNMNISEYRALLKSHNLIMFIEKPLTHVFPELHDENYEQLSSKDKIIPSTSSFQIKRKSKKNISKLETMMENFGFN